MNKDKFLNILNERVLFLDGAYGTEFLKKGYNEKIFDLLNIKNPEAVEQVHKSYIDAGADIIITNTFNSNYMKLKGYNLEDYFVKINQNAVKIAKNVAKENAFVFGDIGPCGTLLEPFGNISFDDAYENFKKQAKILIENGVDGIILETFSDLKELKAAIIAIRDIDSDIPLIAQMTFNENGKTVTGTSIEIFATTINDLNVDVAGVNCYLNPENILPIFSQFAKYCYKKLSIEPNAAKPDIKDGKLNYDIDPIEFAFYSKDYVELGANIVGGCCGTCCDHIQSIVRTIGKRRPAQKEKNTRQYLSSRTILKDTEPFLIVGEKVNASANKKIQNIFLNKEYDKLILLAQEQKDANAIDINFGNEKIISKEIIKDVIQLFDRYSILPLSLDIQDINLLEIALKEYPSRALINSSTSSKKDLERHINLLKKYGGMLIVLSMNNKVSRNYNTRINIIKDAISFINQHNIDIERIYFDPLVLPISAGEDYNISLKVIEYLSKNNFKSIIGLSNLSFGIPDKEKINSSFLALAMDKGLNAAICNCFHITTINIIDGILSLKGKSRKINSKDFDDPLINILLYGAEKELINFIEEKLKNFTPLEISEKFLKEKMQLIGQLYSNGKIYLPQLLICSETIQKGFDFLSKFMVKKDQIYKKGKIMLATVEGDIHDIGKKIVATVLKSMGYEVLDIGKNVYKEIIYKSYLKIKPDIIGLSAMMTSTIYRIKEVKEYFVKKGINVPIIAGGASLNKDIADSFNVYYAKDAFDALNICQSLIKNE